MAKQKGRNDVVYYEMKLEEKIHEKIENNVLEPIKPRFGLEIEKKMKAFMVIVKTIVKFFRYKMRIERKLKLRLL